jgi:hypothetical protein
MLITCKDKITEDTSSNESSIKTDISNQSEIVPNFGNLNMSSGSIVLSESENQSFSDGLRELPIPDFIRHFGEGHPEGKDIYIRMIDSELDTKEKIRSLNSSFHITIWQNEKGKYNYHITGPLQDEEKYNSFGSVKSAKCRNLDQPRKECIVYVTANRLPDDYPNQYYNFKYFKFIMKDDFLYYVIGSGSETNEDALEFLGYPSKGDKFPKTNLEYLKRAIKILNADENEKLKKFYLDSFKSEDLEFFLE